MAPACPCIACTSPAYSVAAALMGHYIPGITSMIIYTFLSSEWTCKGLTSHERGRDGWCDCL